MIGKTWVFGSLFAAIVAVTMAASPASADDHRWGRGRSHSGWFDNNRGGDRNRGWDRDHRWGREREAWSRRNDDHHWRGRNDRWEHDRGRQHRGHEGWWRQHRGRGWN